jgi:hypothetical protein
VFDSDNKHHPDWEVYDDLNVSVEEAQRHSVIVRGYGLWTPVTDYSAMLMQAASVIGRAIKNNTFDHRENQTNIPNSYISDWRLNTFCHNSVLSLNRTVNSAALFESQLSSV